MVKIAQATQKFVSPMAARFRKIGYTGLATLSMLSAGGMAARALTGCGAMDQTCKSSPEPRSSIGFSTPYGAAGINPSPASISLADLAKPEGVAVIWSPESQPGLTNCNGSVSDLTAECRFANNENVLGTFDANGNFSVTKVLQEKMSSPVECALTSYYNAAADETVTLPWEQSSYRFLLYAPNFGNETPDSGTATCENWQGLIDGTLTIEPGAEVTQGESVTVCIPKDAVKDCEFRLMTDADFSAQALFLFRNDEYGLVEDETGTNYCHVIDTSVLPLSQGNAEEVRLKVIDAAHGTIQQKIESVSFYVTGGADGCQQWPLIINELTFSPSNEVDLGAVVRVSIPKDSIIDCEKHPGTNSAFGAEVLFGFNGEDIPALDDGTNFYFDLDTNLYSAGYYELWIRVIDADYETRQDKLNPKGVTIIAGQGTFCAKITGPSEIGATPNQSMIQGADQVYTWEIPNLDCNGLPLSLISHDVDDYLESGASIVVGNTIQVTGRVLPTRNSGSMTLKVADLYGNEQPKYLYLPKIDPFLLGTSSNYIQQGASATYVASILSGGSNYRFWMVDGDGNPVSPVVDQPGNVWSFTTPYLDSLKAAVEYTAYNGDKVAAYYPFIAMEAAGVDPCYTINPPGAIQTTPIKPYVIRGDNTFWLSTLSGLHDCKGNDLSLLSDNLSSVYYNQSINYAGGQVSFSGKMKTDLGSGSTIQLQFGDLWGHTINLVHYTKPIHEPELAILDANNWITVSEDVQVNLMEKPVGANFLWTGNGPESFTSPLLNDPAWTILSANKDTTGLYNLNLAITGEDLVTYYLPGSFIVHEDPTP